ncbi:hypothetical protein GCM10009120_32340 [Sphingobacterium siyangense subsp. cladoniae]
MKLIATQKNEAPKNRKLIVELLILKTRKSNEKIKVYRITDRFCDQTSAYLEEVYRKMDTS